MPSSAEQTVNELKRLALEEILGIQPALIVVDTRRPGVDVPPALEGGHSVLFRISPRFKACFLLVNDRGLAITLTFAGVHYRCVFPWDSVWCISPPNPDSAAYPEVAFPAYVPVERGGPAREDPWPEHPPVERPALRAVKGGLS